MEENNNNENQVKEIIKDKGKQLSKKILKKVLKYIIMGLAILFAILLAVGLLMAVQLFIKNLFNSFVGLFKNNSSSLSSGNKNNSIVYIDDNGYYKFSAEDLVEQILQELEEQQVDSEEFGFISKKTTKNLIEKYVKAEAQTTLLKTGNNSWGQNDIDGTIVVKRATTDGSQAEKLEYINYNSFCALVEAGNGQALKKFSINPENFKLCIAKYESKTTYYDADGNEIETSGGGMVRQEINYKRYVQSYAVPLNFFIVLHLTSQDMDFMQDFLNFVLGDNEKGAIELTYIDGYSSSTTEYQYTGKEINNVKKATEDNGKEIATVLPEEISQEKFEEKKKNIIIDNKNVSNYIGEVEWYKKRTESYSGTLQITSADTWIASASKTLNKSTPHLENKESELIVNKEKIAEILKVRDDEKVEEYILTGRIMIDKKSITTNDGASYTIVNKENKVDAEEFVELIKKYPKVEANLTSAPSNLFYLLQQSQDTQKHEKIMRYVLYILNDIDYGISKEDLELLFKENLTEYNGIGNLKSYLLQFSHGAGYHAPESEDGKYYKMYGDGVGWPTIGDADLQWKSNYKHFEVAGKIKHNGKEMEVANVAEYINEHCLTRGVNATYTNNEVSEMEIYIEKELVDDVGDKVQEAVYNSVVEIDLSGLNLSKQQIYPLVAIRYNFGHLPVRNGKTFKQVYLEGAEKYKEDSWKHNRYIWDEWWWRVQGGSPGHITSRDVQFETYVKGIFDYTTSKSRDYYVYYTQEQISQISYAPSRTITRDKNNKKNEEEIFTLEIKSGVYESVSGDSRVIGYYTSTMGRRFTVLYQNACSNWGYKCNRAAAAIIASGYKDESVTDLINTMDTAYAAGGDTSVPRDVFWNQYGLKLVSDVYKSYSVSEYTQILSENLSKGNYAMIWVQGKPYKGKSGKTWTGEIHWVAILDYKIGEDGNEKIAIADMSGAAWYDIDEFSSGISRLAIISEE